MKIKTCFFFSYLFLLGACKNNQSDGERERLLSESNRLIKELASANERNEQLKKTADSLKSIIHELTQARDTLQQKMKKQADLEALRLKALNKPLEMPTFSVINEAANGSPLKTKSPFKKNEVRYLSFKGTAVNNVAKNKQILRGRLYAIYRLGGLVQRMDNTSGTFTGSDNKKYVFTNAWELKSDKETIALDKGIGDKSRGIFEKGNWTLELWFEALNKGNALKISEAKFEIN